MAHGHHCFAAVENEKMVLEKNRMGLVVLAVVFSGLQLPQNQE
jgi:hypothetical protein